ncbi:MAG: glycoside hydrolase family 13 protein [Lachnospiraceae bacterium]|nr:glycoside hydrolase family 13 protein [Lachnospiraceae bacterium]
MIREALFHKAESTYSFSSGPEEVTLRFRTAVNDELLITVLYNGKYDFRLSQKELPMEKIMADELFAYYSVTIKLTDLRFVYIFRLSENGRDFYFTEEGLSEQYDFENCHFNAFQLPYVNKADTLSPVEWLNNAIFYQIFIDRFYQAEGTNKETAYINLKWGKKPGPKSFAGGDLKGICEKLDYLLSLGVTALYLNPIFSAPSNHKYDTWDYFEIDPMFGTKEDFKELVKTAHDKGIRVVLDAVFNHCGEGFMPWKDVVKNGSKSRYYPWFYVNGKEFEYFGISKHMPKLNTENDECAEYLLKVAEYWLKEFDIDGWRIDVSDEVPHVFWRKFRNRVKEIKADCAIIGENWHDAEPFLRGDQFDSTMNYAFTKAAIDYFAKGTLTEKSLSERINSMLARNTDIVNNMLFNLVDNHDTHRFLRIVGEDALKLRAAVALGFMLPGSFCIYYGTEIDMTGGYDPDCRRCFDWLKPAGETFALIKRLAKLKKNHVMKSGTTRVFFKDGLFALEREYQGEKIIFTLKGLAWEIRHFENGVIING